MNHCRRMLTLAVLFSIMLTGCGGQTNDSNQPDHDPIVVDQDLCPYLENRDYRSIEWINGTKEILAFVPGSLVFLDSAYNPNWSGWHPFNCENGVIRIDITGGKYGIIESPDLFETLSVTYHSEDEPYTVLYTLANEW